jgi:hypothetical protein
MYSRRWLIAALAVLGLAGGCSQFNTNLTNQTSSSVLTFLSPASVAASAVPSTGLAITANGAGFVPGAIVLWNLGPSQIQLTTTFVSNNQLTATVPASNFTNAGTVQVAVQIPGSAVSGSSSTTATTTTEVSNRVNFNIGAAAGPAPMIASVSAPSTSLSSTPYCQPNGFTLTVNGSNFDNGSVVNWNGLPRVTTFGSSGLLTASILATDTAFPGVARISVSNAAGISNTATFTTTNPATNLPGPSIISLSQTTATAGSPTFTLSVTGSSFVPCSVVRWDGSEKATTYVSATQLDATIPAADVFTAGAGGTTARTVQVTVFTLTPGGGTSGAITFTINP